MFTNAQDMQKLIDAYFAYCDERDKPGNMSGLAYYLGFSSRQSLWEYSQKPEFADTLTRARLKVEADTVDCGMQGRGNANFVMFNLMNNFNGAGHDRWESVKKQELEHNVKADIVTALDKARQRAKGEENQ